MVTSTDAVIEATRRACLDRGAIPSTLDAVDKAIVEVTVARDELNACVDEVFQHFGPTDLSRGAVAVHHAMVRLIAATGDTMAAGAAAERRRADLAGLVPCELPAPAPAPDELEANRALAGLDGLLTKTRFDLEDRPRVELALTYAIAHHRGEDLEPDLERLAWALAVAELGTTVDCRRNLTDVELERFISAAWTVHIGAARRGPDVDLLDLATGSTCRILARLGDRHGRYVFRDLARPFLDQDDDGGVTYPCYHAKWNELGRLAAASRRNGRA